SLPIYATNLSQAMDQVNSNAPPKKSKKKASPEGGFLTQASHRAAVAIAASKRLAAVIAEYKPA
ncbi:hypothetical protein PIB30_059380, partial [Stylosanthes scabra]|nr:hypothetical protein [Stylosanthes scabra]